MGMSDTQASDRSGVGVMQVMGESKREASDGEERDVEERDKGK